MKTRHNPREVKEELTRFFKTKGLYKKGASLILGYEPKYFDEQMKNGNEYFRSDMALRIVSSFPELNPDFLTEGTGRLVADLKALDIILPCDDFFLHSTDVHYPYRDPSNDQRRLGPTYDWRGNGVDDTGKLATTSFHFYRKYRNSFIFDLPDNVLIDLLEMELAFARYRHSHGRIVDLRKIDIVLDAIRLYYEQFKHMGYSFVTDRIKANGRFWQDEDVSEEKPVHPDTAKLHEMAKDALERLHKEDKIFGGLKLANDESTAYEQEYEDGPEQNMEI